MVAIIGSLVGWLLGLFVGGLALFVAGQLVHGGQGNVEHSLWTALIGTVAWGVLSWVPLVGVLLAPVAWIAVIKWRYPGDWAHAITVAVVAWLVALGGLFVLDVFGLGGFDAVGIPFV